MPTIATKKNVDEIDVTELILNLWSYKYLIILVTVFSIFISGIYAIKSEKIYTANSKFILKETSDDNLGSKVSEVIQLASLADKNSPVALLIERLNSREFILEVSDTLNLRADRFFNDYDPLEKDPVWKKVIKYLVGWQKREIELEQIADWNVIKSFEKKISIQETEAGAVSINVDHIVPEKAAAISNAISNMAINLVEKDKKGKENNRLSYLSTSVAEALEDLNERQKQLKNFTLENSFAAVQSLSMGSVVLDELRSKRDQSIEQSKTVSAMQTAITTSSTPVDYSTFRTQFPLVDDTAFRRLLGISEIISAWTWPNLETLKAVRINLDGRILSLNAKISQLEKDAAKYGLSAEKYAELSRNVKIAEATYTVLMEQVKGQALIAGYDFNSSKIIAIAAPPIVPSKPQRDLVLAIGAVIGLISGIAIALSLNVRNQVYFSQKRILEALNPRFVHKTGSMRKYQSSDLTTIMRRLTQNLPNWPKQIILETLSDKQFRILVMLDIAGTDTAITISRLIGACASELGHNVAIINLSNKPNTSTNAFTEGNIGKIEVVDRIENCTEYKFSGYRQNSEFVYQKNYKETIEALFSNHDFLFLSGNISEINALKASMIWQQAQFVTYFQKGKTSINLIEQISESCDVRVALHV